MEFACVDNMYIGISNIVKLAPDYILNELSYDNKLTREHWDCISKRNNLSSDFVDRHWFMLDWDYIDEHGTAPKHSLFSYKKNRDYWTGLSMSSYANMPFIHRYRKFINWNAVSTGQLLSDDFIERHDVYIVWNRMFDPKVSRYSERCMTTYNGQYIERENQNFYDRLPFYLYENKKEYDGFLERRELFDISLDTFIKMFQSDNTHRCIPYDYHFITYKYEDIAITKRVLHDELRKHFM